MLSSDRSLLIINAPGLINVTVSLISLLVYIDRDQGNLNLNSSSQQAEAWEDGGGGGVYNIPACCMQGCFFWECVHVLVDCLLWIHSSSNCSAYSVNVTSSAGTKQFPLKLRLLQRQECGRGRSSLRMRNNIHLTHPQHGKISMIYSSKSDSADSQVYRRVVLVGQTKGSLKSKINSPSSELQE